MSLKTTYAIVTGCTNRKRTTAPDTLLAQNLTEGSLEAVTTEWVQKLASTQVALQAGTLYVGRGFQEARSAAQSLGAKHFIVSAGLGLITTDDLAPPYSLTITKASDDCIFPKLPKSVTPSEWWSALVAASPLHTPLDGSKLSMVIVALPRDYLRMVTPLLETAAKQTQLRILTRTDKSFLSKQLQEQCIAYGDRIDGKGSTNSGTLSDFITRCARHFTEQILPSCPNGTIAEHQQIVDTCLAAFPARQVPDRQKTSDEEIKHIIDKDWNIVNGRSGKMLRRLRDDLQIACEQSRFQGLFQQVAGLRLKS